MKVEDYLNQISYKEDKGYIPSTFALEFINFIKLVNGSRGEENKTPIIHYKILDTICNKETNIANMLFRGASKTTLCAEYLILYIAVYGEIPGFGKIPLGLYVSDSIENGVKNMRKNLEYRWENSEFLQAFIPKGNVRFTDIRWEFKNVDGVVTVFKGYGASTGVRGSKELGQRPYLAILDDLISDNDARSPTIIAAIEDTVYKAIDYALHPNRKKILWLGTPFNSRDPLYKAIESGAWKVNVFPVCESFPCTRKEFIGAWEDRFNYDYVKSQYDKALKSGKIDTFNQELMLRIMSDEDRLITDSDIRWFKREDVIKNKDIFNFYITTDFATSEKTSSDYSFISVWAYNANGDWFWIDGICKKQLMDKNIDDLFRLVQMYKPQQVGVEVTGQQGGFIPWLNQEMMKRNIWFTLASDNNSSNPGIRPNTNKMQRFNIVVPWFKTHKMFFPEEMKLSEPVVELMDELRLASAGGFKSKHDDACFTGETLILLNTGETKQIKDIKENDLVMTLALDTIAMPACSAIMTGNKEVQDYFFSNGSVISMTRNHPILTTLGWIQAKDITSETKIIWSNVCKLNSMDINGLNVNQGITNQAVILKENEDGCINGFGKNLMENSLKDTLCITKMKTKIIILLKTWFYFHTVVIKVYMDFKEIWNNKKFILSQLEVKPQNGISQMKEKFGIKRIMQNVKQYYMKRNTLENVSFVKQKYNLILNPEECFALQNVLLFVNPPIQQNLNLLNVNGVKQPSCGTDGKKVVLKNVEIIYLDKKENLRNENTYNFEVKDSHNYVLANGIIAHNCDTISMLASMTAWKPSEAIPLVENKELNIWQFAVEESKDYNQSYFV